MKKRFSRIMAVGTIGLMLGLQLVFIAPAFASSAKVFTPILVGKTSATIRGIVDGVADTTYVDVNYGPRVDQVVGFTVPVFEKDGSFAAPVPGLTIDTIYYYEVVDTTSGKNVVLTKGSFRTLSATATTGTTDTTKGDAANVNVDITQALQIKNPIAGATDLNGYITKILESITLVLTPFLVIMFIYSAFLFVTAQGNAEKLSEAKRAFIYTLIGITIVFASEGLARIIGNTVKCLAENSGCK